MALSLPGLIAMQNMIDGELEVSRTQDQQQDNAVKGGEVQQQQGHGDQSVDTTVSQQDEKDTRRTCEVHPMKLMKVVRGAPLKLATIPSALVKKVQGVEHSTRGCPVLKNLAIRLLKITRHEVHRLGILAHRRMFRFMGMR